MRRFLTTLVLGLVAVGVLASAAAAKEMSVSLASRPPTLDPGKPWTAELLVHGEPAMLKQATPGITFRDRESGETKTFDATATGRRAADGQLLFRARVVLPEGLWEWGLVDGVTDRLYEGGLVRVGDPASAAPSTPAPAARVASPASDGAPRWPFVAGGIAVLLLAAVAALVVRNRLLLPTA